MRIGATVALLTASLLAASACHPGDFFRQYEYEEDTYLSLDGSATVYVNASVVALNALRGTSFDTSASAQIGRQAVRDVFSSPVTRVTGTPTLSRRRGRTFVHVRLDVDHLEQLGKAALFAWSTYQLSRDGDLIVYRQRVGVPAAKAVGDVGWTGQEIVAFRAHLPSTIVYHNAGRDNLRRGNILVWEQTLTQRLRGEPVEMEARIESASILFRTLLLFGASALAVTAALTLVVWSLVRRGRAVATRPSRGP